MKNPKNIYCLINGDLLEDGALECDRTCYK